MLQCQGSDWIKKSSSIYAATIWGLVTVFKSVRGWKICIHGDLIKKIFISLKIIITYKTLFSLDRHSLACHIPLPLLMCQHYCQACELFLSIQLFITSVIQIAIFYRRNFLMHFFDCCCFIFFFSHVASWNVPCAINGMTRNKQGELLDREDISLWRKVHNRARDQQNHFWSERDKIAWRRQGFCLLDHALPSLSSRLIFQLRDEKNRVCTTYHLV